MATKLIKGVIFDYGGIFCRVDDQMVTDYIAESFDTPVKEFQPVFSRYIGLLDKGLIEEDDFWQKISLNLGKPVPGNKEILFSKKWLEYVVFYEEMFAFVKKIKKSGFKTAVLSRVIKRLAEIVKGRNGYDDFDVVVLSYEVQVCKPDPKIYLLTAEKLGLSPENCLYIDDNPDYLIPAKKLEMRVLLGKNSKQIIGEVSELLKLENNLIV